MSAFLKEPTEEALERICDAHWNNGGDGVVFLDIQKHNACNHTLSGTINVDGVVHGFIIDNGDWAGTVVKAWGDPEDVGVAAEPEQPEARTFVPKNDNLYLDRPELFRVYAAWRKEEWFQKQERDYAYDRFFQPGGLIEKHYAALADKRGMKIGYLSTLPAAVLAML